jgi:hypothetical protein
MAFPLTRAVAGLVLTVAALTACGDDGDGNTEVAVGEVVTVTAVDYGYRGVPATVRAGSRLELVNESRSEAHELAVIRLPDGERRPIERILELPEPEVAQVLPDDAVEMVLVAAPDSRGRVLVGDGTLDRPGRYALLCFLPTGANPDAVMEALDDFDPATDGEPQLPEAGPPHVAHGMFAEVTVR